VQLVEQRLSLFQIERVDAFGEPAVDRGEKIAGRIPLALIAPQPRHTHRRAQLPGLCLLLTRNRERTLEITFRFRGIALWRLERNFAGDAVDLGLEPPFLSYFHIRYRFANAAPSIIKLAEFAWALAKHDRYNVRSKVAPDDRHALMQAAIFWTASEGLPVNARMLP